MLKIREKNTQYNLSLSNRIQSILNHKVNITKEVCFSRIRQDRYLHSFLCIRMYFLYSLYTNWNQNLYKLNTIHRSLNIRYQIDYRRFLLDILFRIHTIINHYLKSILLSRLDKKLVTRNISHTSHHINYTFKLMNFNKTCLGMQNYKCFSINKFLAYKKYTHCLILHNKWHSLNDKMNILFCCYCHTFPKEDIFQHKTIHT